MKNPGEPLQWGFWVNVKKDFDFDLVNPNTDIYYQKWESGSLAGLEDSISQQEVLDYIDAGGVG